VAKDDLNEMSRTRCAGSSKRNVASVIIDTPAERRPDSADHNRAKRTLFRVQVSRPNFPRRYNMAPTQQAPIIRAGEGGQS
jgi:hypothetical protein